jgi:DNA-binding NtrC family response regulator
MLTMTPSTRTGKPRPHPDDRYLRDAAAVQLIRDGWTVAAAARVTGITERHLYRRLAQLKAETPPQPQDQP